MRLPAPQDLAVWPMPSFHTHPPIVAGITLFVAARIERDGLRACKMRRICPAFAGRYASARKYGKQKVKQADQKRRKVNSSAPHVAKYPAISLTAASEAG